MYAKNMIDGIKSTSAKTTDKVISEKVRGTMAASFIGGGVGLAIAYQRKANLLFGIFLGAAIAGILSNIYIDKQFTK